MGKLIKQVGKRIRRLRGEQTLVQFANRIGVSKSTLQRIELGEQNLTVTTLEQIAVNLKIDIRDLMAPE